MNLGRRPIETAVAQTLIALERLSAFRAPSVRLQIVGVPIPERVPSRGGALRVGAVGCFSPSRLRIQVKRLGFAASGQGGGARDQVPRGGAAIQALAHIVSGAARVHAPPNLAPRMQAVPVAWDAPAGAIDRIGGDAHSRISLTTSSSLDSGISSSRGGRGSPALA